MATKTSKKKTGSDANLFVVNRRSRWVEWIDANDPDGVPFRARIRSNLTFGELDVLTFEPGVATTEVHRAMVPYVLEWNVAVEEHGDIAEVPAPVELGADAFTKIPNRWFWWLFNQVKIEGAERLDPKGFGPSEPTPASDADTIED